MLAKNVPTSSWSWSSGSSQRLCVEGIGEDFCELQAANKNCIVMIVITSSVKTSIVGMASAVDTVKTGRLGVDLLRCISFTDRWRLLTYVKRLRVCNWRDYTVCSSQARKIRQQYKNHIAYKWQKQAAIHSCFDGSDMEAAKGRRRERTMGMITIPTPRNGNGAVALALAASHKSSNFQERGYRFNNNDNNDNTNEDDENDDWGGWDGLFTLELLVGSFACRGNAGNGKDSRSHGRRWN